MDATTFDTLRALAAENRWELLLPEISLGVIALALLVLDLFLPRGRRALVGVAALAGYALVFVTTLLFARETAFGTETSIFGGLLFQGGVSEVMRLFFIVAGFVVTWLGIEHGRRRGLPGTEFAHLVMVTTAALMLLVQSSHFVVLFMALETVTVAFYVLVAYQRSRVASLEAGMKYLILGALSSAILLFGIMLLYAAGGNPGLPGHAADPLQFGQLGAFIQANADLTVVRLGALLVVAGILFKIGTVPFQVWIPDVYQGAPTPVTSFLAVGSKAAGVVVLLNLVLGPFDALTPLLVPVLSAVAIVTILFGNLAALSQRNVKRLVGLSGVSHAGYLLIGVVAAISVGREAVIGVVFYLVAYLLATFAVLAVVTLVAPDDDSQGELEDYEDLLRDRPFLGTVLVLGLGSMAGIPPLAGFIGKLLILLAAFEAGLYALVAFALVGVVLSIYYYFGWILQSVSRTLRLPPAEEAQAAAPRVWPEVSLGTRMLLIALAGLSVVLGFHQELLGFLG